MKMVWALPIAIALLSPHAHATESLTDLELPTCAVSIQIP